MHNLGKHKTALNAVVFSKEPKGSFFIAKAARNLGEVVALPRDVKNIEADIFVMEGGD